MRKIGEFPHWYDVLESFISKIPPRNIHNFDETGFQLSQGKAQQVVATRPNQTKRGRTAKDIGELVPIDAFLRMVQFYHPTISSKMSSIWNDGINQIISQMITA